MSLRVLVANSISPGFVAQVRRRQPDLQRQPYREQLDALLFESFAWSDAYALEFRKLGHEADTVLVNEPGLARQWAAEHGMRDVVRTWDLLRQGEKATKGIGVVRGLLLQRQRSLLNQVFLAQVKALRPDILLVQLQVPLATSTIREAHSYCGAVVAQIASRFPAYLDFYQVYDLIFSAYPHFVSFFNECGLPSVYLPLAFEPAFLERCRQRFGAVDEPRYEAVFIGSVAATNVGRLQWLNALAETGVVDIWLSFDSGHRADSLPEAIRRHLHEPVYGLAMYDVYRRSRIVLNAHPEMAGRYASVMRMFEATGSGAMLMTEAQPNLSDFFRLDSEVVAYESAEDCVSKMQYYLSHETARAAIAQHGQQRTLSEHTYYERAAEIIEQTAPYLSRGAR